MNIEFTTSPQSEDTDFLTKQLFGTHALGDFLFTEIMNFYSNELGELIAGCTGFLTFGVIYTDQLWVHLDHRNQGLGRTLMEHVHDYGRETGCRVATTVSMSFQAPKFYQKLGYEVEFEHSGYEDDAKLISLKKIL